MQQQTTRLIVAAALGAHALACSVATEDTSEASVRSEHQAVIGVDTHLYLRCGATNWTLGEESRFQPTSVPGVLELEANVDQPWQVNVTDYCQMVETNELNGWGTAQTGYSSTTTLEHGASVGIDSNYGVVPVNYPELGTFRFRYNVATSELSLVDDVPPEPVDMTSRMTELLAGVGGSAGFYAKEVGGPVLGSLLAEEQFDPASSIKILVAVGIMQKVDVGIASLDETTSFFPDGLNGSCPTSTGVEESRTLGELIDLMLSFSDNVATRSLIDRLGGFAGVNQVATWLGLTGTNMNVYPGCNITNTMTLLDLASVYEGIADATIVSPESRDALYARMPSSTIDFTGTHFRARRIIDELAPSYGLSENQVQEFKDALLLHYKAGNDTWCTPGCLEYYSIGGVAEIPVCEGSTQTDKDFVWGLFIDGAPRPDGGATFFPTHAEPLREPLDEALSTWAQCSAP